MLHKIFNGNIFLQLAVIFITAFLLWATAFSNSIPMPLPDSVSPLYNFMYNWLHNSPLLYTIIAFILVLGEAFLLNNLLTEYGISPKNSFQTAFWYVILMSFFRGELTLHPVIFVNLCIIVVLLMIFRATSREECYKEVFTSGFFIALASLFLFKSMGLLVAFWIFLIVLQVYSWREWLIILIGICSVYLYMYAYYLYFGDIAAKIIEYKHYFQNISFLPQISDFKLQSVYTNISIIIILLLSVISFVKILIIVSEKIIYIRRMTLILIWLFVIIIGISVFINSRHLDDYYLALLPLSVLISYYYFNIKRLVFSEIFFLMLIASLILQRIIS